MASYFWTGEYGDRKMLRGKQGNEYKSWGISLLRESAGTWIERQQLHPDDYTNYVTVLRGGFRELISYEHYLELIAAGYEDYLEGFDEYTDTYLERFED